MSLKTRYPVIFLRLSHRRNFCENGLILDNVRKLNVYKTFRRRSVSVSREQISEVATGGALYKKVFLKISQNSHENACARFSFLIKLPAETYNFIKKDTLAQVLPSEFYEIFLKVFFAEHLRVTASQISVIRHFWKHY